MNWLLFVEHERKKYRVFADLIMADKEKEQYRITTRSKSIVIQSNRPLLRNKGLKHKKPIWKVVEGESKSPYLLDKVIEALMKEIDK